MTRALLSLTRIQDRANAKAELALRPIKRTSIEREIAEEMDRSVTAWLSRLPAITVSTMLGARVGRIDASIPKPAPERLDPNTIFSIRAEGDCPSAGGEVDG